VKGWQLLYRTTGAKGEPLATVTTVIVPANFEANPDTPLLSYQAFEDSVGPQCAPSYQLRQTLNWDAANVQLELIFIGAAARRGWVVTVPDHEGPHGAFIAGRMSGHATLDALRATKAFSPLGLDDGTPMGMWGYSGGAHATGWAAELAPTYAPELNIKGAAAGGMPPSVQPVYDKLNGGWAAGIPITGITGLAQGYPELKDWLDQHLTAEGQAAVQTVRGQCLPFNVIKFAFVDIDEYVDVPDPLNQPVPAAVLKDNTMSSTLADAPPMFVYHSIMDELIPIGPTDQLVQSRCAAGATITYQRDLLSEHVINAISGGPDAFIWLENQLTGTPPARGCQTKNVASGLDDPEAVYVLGRVVLDTLLDVFLHRPVQPAPGWGPSTLS
jgi:secretory lipase